VDDFALYQGSPCYCAPVDSRWVAYYVFLEFTRLAERRLKLVMGVLWPGQGGRIRLAKSCGRFHECVEHRLQIERRPADYLQYIGSRSLLLQRFPQFVQQPRVLDGDDGLGGEVGQQIDMLPLERADFRSANYDGANRLALSD
jgi:hypothetical protein